MRVRRTYPRQVWAPKPRWQALNAKERADRMKLVGRRGAEGKRRTVVRPPGANALLPVVARASKKAGKTQQLVCGPHKRILLTHSDEQKILRKKGVGRVVAGTDGRGVGN